MKKQERFELLELDVDNLKTGDMVLIRYAISPIAALIRFFINLNKPISLRSPYNHVAMVIVINGYPYIAEAKGSGTCTLESAKTRLKGKKIAIRRAKFSFQPNGFLRHALRFSYNGVKYDWVGTFFEQLILQLTGYKKNKSGVSGDARLYCSEYYARVINLVNPKYYSNYYHVDPQDLYVDDIFETVYEGKVKLK